MAGPHRKKCARPFFIGLKLGVVGILGFEHGNARNVEQQKSDGKRADDGPQPETKGWRRPK